MSKNSFAVSLIILIVALTSIKGISSRGEPVVVSKNLVDLPMTIAGYKASKDHFSDSIVKELNTDVYVYRHYRHPDGNQIDLYIGYYGTSKGGRTGHNPYACLPGAGWGIIDSKKILLKPKDYSKEVALRFILSQKGESYESMIHWYQSDRNKVLSSGIQQNIQRFIGRVLYNRNDGAFVQVSTISGHEKLEESALLMKDFAEKILEVIPQYWPIEK